MLLAVDPGMNSPGVALFVPNTPGMMLRHAVRVAVPAGFIRMPDGARWMHVAREIVSWAQARGHVDSIIFERPQWYARGKSKGDPNQLAGVAGVAANVTGMLYATGISVFSPTPAEWIGQVSKVCPVCKGKKSKPADPDFARAMKAASKRKRPLRIKAVCPECRGSAWETPRGRLIRKRLTADELALVPDQNDAIDAVGLGLFALGRLEPVRVFSNGRDGH